MESIVKIVLLMGAIMVCKFSFGAEKEENEGKINESTYAGRFSTTPVYKTIYEIDLVELDVSCDDEEKEIKQDNKKKLPAGSKFRKTFDSAAQNDKEMVVHVFDVNSANKDEFYKRPFKLCTAGRHYVPKSKYNRVGGLNTGILFVPFKMRGGDLYADSEVGPYVSIKFEKLEYLVNFGVSQIAFSEIGTKDVEYKTGLTFAAGISFEADKNWDIAALVGVDHLSGSAGDTWEFQDEPWLSFSIGFNFTR